MLGFSSGSRNRTFVFPLKKNAKNVFKALLEGSFWFVLKFFIFWARQTDPRFSSTKFGSMVSLLRAVSLLHF